MESSKLKLIVEKGPKEGETLGCVPGSVIRIGRIVRGNTFAIKDAGISSKHLLIEFKVGKWVVSDLDTSNGTMLNGVKLRALVDFDIRNGDVIKIGEWTSFKVEIEDVVTKAKKSDESVEIAEEICVGSRLRRLPSRRAAPTTTRVSKGEASEPALVSALTSIAEVQKNSESLNIVIESVREPENVAPVEEKRTRRGAPRKAKASSKDVHSATSEVQEVPQCSNTGGENYKIDDVAPLVKKQTRRVAPKRTRATTKDESLGPVAEMPKVLENLSIEEPHKLDRMEEDQTQAVETKKDQPLESVAERPKVLENLIIEEPHKLDQMEENQTEGVVQRRTDDSPDQPSGSGCLPVSEVLEIPKNSNLQEESGKESVTTAANDNPVPPKAEKLDWEKMTLGEWFDYLEVYLPRQINEATDEIISSMRERSKQFNEFMSQHQGGKGKLPMS